MEKINAGNPADTFTGPKQRAQQLKKQRINKVLRDLACKNEFFMIGVRHDNAMRGGWRRGMRAGYGYGYMTADISKRP